jgi:hypothetical protein
LARAQSGTRWAFATREAWLCIAQNRSCELCGLGVTGGFEEVYRELDGRRGVCHRKVVTVTWMERDLPESA